MRILVVEDHPALGEGIVTALGQAGYAVDIATDGEQADDFLRADKYDMLVLDLNLPKMDGLEVLKLLRERSDPLPVLILTARNDVSDRIRGLDLGADDYLAKPFELGELEARVRALLRRQTSQKNTALQCGEIVFDTVGRTCRIKDSLIELPRRELCVLEALLLKKGQVVDKEALASHVANFDDALTPNAIELYVSRLRKRLDQADVMIKTVRGLGYLLDKR
jgi:DNA-binding response OmpR family regulator